jgi:hypothetical protein
LQAGEALLQEAIAPVPDRMAVAIQFRGDLQVGGLVPRSGAQHDLTAEGQGLGRGAGAGEQVQTFPDLIGEGDRTWQWHDRHPCNQGNLHGRFASMP